MGTIFEVTDRADTNPANHARRLTRGSGRRRAAARWIVAAAVIGLTALSIALAAPASAHGSRGGVDSNHHRIATTSVHTQGGDSMSSTAPSSGTRNVVVDPPAGNPSASEMPQVHPGHDKCKAEKGGRSGPPWCDDPSAGWEQSTLHRTDASYPTLPGAQAAAEAGRSAATRGAVH